MDHTPFNCFFNDILRINHVLVLTLSSSLGPCRGGLDPFVSAETGWDTLSAKDQAAVRKQAGPVITSESLRITRLMD
jgi:hypothetical protein